MKRTIQVPGATLRVGDVVISAGMRYEIVTMPYVTTSELTGRHRVTFETRPLFTAYVPQVITFAKNTDSLWTIEVTRARC